MAGRKDKLTDKVLGEICELSKLQISQKEIARSVGIDPGTLRRWMAKGCKAKTGKYRKLVDTYDQNQDDAIIQANKVIYNALFEPTGKIVTKEVLSPDGRIVPLKTTTITQPTFSDALKFLERRDPRWVQRRHTQIDMHTHLRAEGFDDNEIAESDAELSAAIAETIENES